MKFAEIFSRSQAEVLLRNVLALYNANYFHLSATAIAAGFTFLPLGTGNSNIEDSPLREALRNGILFRDISIVLLALLTPLVIDSTLDLLKRIFIQEKRPVVKSKVSKVDDCSFNLPERILFLLGMFVVPVNIFIPADYPNAALIFVCCRKCRFALFGGVIVCTLSRDAQIIPKLLALFCVTLYLIAQVLGSYAANTLEGNPTDVFYGGCYLSNEILTYIPLIIVLLCIIIWLLRISNVDMKICGIRVASVGTIDSQKQKQSSTLANQNQQAQNNNNNSNSIYHGDYLRYRVLFVLAIIICAIFGSFASTTYANNAYLDDAGLGIDSLPYVLFVVLQSALSMRLVKFEALQGLYALLDSKKQYVRYISHEIRTPLNAAFLGLKILIDDLKKSSTPKDIDRFETLTDVNISCMTAIDILNDLLTFDKLESGILELHKEATSPLSFVEDCVKLFSAQAKANGIALRLNPVTAVGESIRPHIQVSSLSLALPPSERISVSGVASSGSAWGQESETESVLASAGGIRVESDCPATPQSLPPSLQLPESLPLLDTDVVMVDKFKVSQVVRNLISNALKFTPQGGTVTVHTSFIPSADLDKSASLDSLSASASASPSPSTSLKRRNSLLQKTKSAKRMFLNMLRNDKLQRAQKPKKRNTKKRVGIDDSGAAGGSGGGSAVHDNAQTIGSSSFLRSPQISSFLYRLPNSRGVSENENEDSFEPNMRNAMISGMLKVTVTDSGAGISLENQKKLFKEIVQFNPEILQAGGGSGFGLYICKGIMDLHGGSIIVFSEGEGHGCTFTLELPMERVSADESNDLNPLIESSDEDDGEGEDDNIGEKGDGEGGQDNKGERRNSHNHSHNHSNTNNNGNQNHCSGKKREMSIVPPPDSPSDMKLKDSVKVKDKLKLKSFRGSGRDSGRIAGSGLKTPRGVEGKSNNNSFKYYRRRSTRALPHSPGARAPNKYSMLIVDDSKMNRKMLMRLLTEAGHTCDEADDGLTAVAAVKRKMAGEAGGAGGDHYDAILMDFIMPNLDGPSATKQIRDLGYKWPIFGVTGNGLTSDIEHFVSHGANTVFVKPFDIDSFHTEMRGYEWCI